MSFVVLKWFSSLSQRADWLIEHPEIVLHANNSVELLIQHQGYTSHLTCLCIWTGYLLTKSTDISLESQLLFIIYPVLSYIRVRRFETVKKYIYSSIHLYFVINRFN